MFDVQDSRKEIPDDRKLILDHYDLTGEYPTSKNDVVLVVDPNNAISQSALNSLGLDKFSILDNKKVIEYKNIIGHTYKILPNNDFYIRGNLQSIEQRGIFFKNQYELEKSGLKLIDLTNYLDKVQNLEDSNDFFQKENLRELLNYISMPKNMYDRFEKVNFDDEDEVLGFFQDLFQTRYLDYYNVNSKSNLEQAYEDDSKGVKLKITGILKAKEGEIFPPLDSGLYYTKDLAEYVTQSNSKEPLDDNNNGIIEPEEDKRSSIAKSYENNLYLTYDGNIHINTRTILNESIVDNDFVNYFLNRKKLGVETYVNSVGVFCPTLEAKNRVALYLDAYNKDKNEIDKITYVDFTGTIFSLVYQITSVIESSLIVISILSLISSSIMISVLTINKVEQQVKQIGIFRSLGASKNNIRFIYMSDNGIQGILSASFSVIAGLIIALIMNSNFSNLYPFLKGVFIFDFNIICVLSTFGIGIVLPLIFSFIPSLIASNKDIIKVLKDN